jgi:uroporphyrinogen-III decarboxylase
MLRDYEAEVETLLELLDDKLQGLVEELCRLPGATLISPDNLDGQYISPDLFEKYLAQSYRLTHKMSKQAGKDLVVHVGGPMKHIVSLLAEAGVDVIEGVSGPPQSDLPLDQARQLAGQELTLWGGIPQDWLLKATAIEAFEDGVEQVVEAVLRDGNAILGVADRVPVAAEVDRLQRLQAMVESFTG